MDGSRTGRASDIGDQCQAALERAAAGEQHAVRRLIEACGAARDWADELAAGDQRVARAG